MATGVRGRELAGNRTPVASVEDFSAIALPARGEVARLDYPGRADERAVITSAPGRFLQLRADGELRADAIEPNALVLADNLAALASLHTAAVRPELVYLDPPYGTGSDFQSRQLSHAYEDPQADARYAEYLRRRLILTKECMSDTGSIYLHIGHHMVGHAKVIMDEIFGSKNFRNIITRRKCSSKNFTKMSFPNLHDFVLFYTKGKIYKWTQPAARPSEEWIEREYPKSDKKGRYKLVPIHAPGSRQGATGQPWRGLLPPPGKHWQYAPVVLDRLDEAGEIHWSRNGNPRRKVYLTADKRVALTDYWAGFRDAHHQSINVTGYPTEKNRLMLEMIVGASSDDNDVVLDPFCGSGTTLEAAERLGRRWIGVDQSFSAVETAIRRMRYGSQPMGDFVSPQKGAALHGERPAVFSLLADARVFAGQEKRLRALARL